METPDGSDWRLQGQERYLTGAKLAFGPYRRYPTNPDWDHDHCEFCGVKFMVEADPEPVHEGYHTVDEYRWICSACFVDFRGRFGWELVEPKGDASQVAAERQVLRPARRRARAQSIEKRGGHE